MTLNEFNQLPTDEQTNYLWDHGVCLGQRVFRGRYVVCIFSLDDFFVEARYSKHNNGIDSILPLTDVMMWEAYVDQVVRQQLYLS